jgi:hypothetical protein
MNNDLTFFTNKPNATLFDRFRKTLKDSRFSDILVGCHSANGFHKLPDPFLADAIELLTVDHEGLHAPEAPAFIDYSSLSVRHLGDIYEGILEFHIQVAEEDVVEIRKDEKSLWAKASAIKEGIRVNGKRTKGEVYIENSRHERKATGSFYTPHFSVEYIVGNIAE